MNATFAVPADSTGARLDVFLVSVLAGQSRSHIQRLIKDGHVRVDGREAKPNLAVKAGQAVAVEIPDPIDPEPQPEALPLPIVYQDRDLIVVDKPAGMVVHPAAGHATGTLVNALLHHVDDLSGWEEVRALLLESYLNALGKLKKVPAASKGKPARKRSA